MHFKSLFSGLMQDVRYALRLLRREPGFSVVALLTIALGIGASAALFSTIDAVLLRPLPWQESDRLVRVEERRGGLKSTRPWTLTNGAYHAWAKSPESIEAIGAWMLQTQTLTGEGDPERVPVALSTPSLFSVLKVRPAIGRLFVEEDSEFGRSGTIILSDRLWKRRFGADRAILGQAIELGGRSFEVIGVMADRFTFPDRETQAWIAFRPPSLLSPDGTQMRLVSVGALARLKPGVSISQAADEATARARTVPDIRQAALSIFGSRGDASVAVTPAHEVVTAETKPALLILAMAVSLLLVAAITSVLSVQLARSSARRHETAIRTALGAGRMRLTRMWLVESTVIGLSAGVLGVVIAMLLCRLLPTFLPADLPRLDAISVDLRSMLVAIALALFVSVICGVVPAIMSKPTPVSGALSEDGGAPLGFATRTRVGRVRSGIIVGQVAIACLLLIGGSLLARSFLAMVQADRGYSPSNLLTAKLTFPDSHSEGPAMRIQVLERLQERLLGMEGNSIVAFGNGLPLVHHGNVFGGSIPSPRDATQSLQISATWRIVSPQYFKALGMRFSAGGPFPPGMTEASPGMLVVNQAFATEYLGPQPVGQRLKLALSSQPDWEVVGVVDNVRQGDLGDAPRPEFYVSYQQAADSLAFDPMLLIRSEGERVVDANSLRALVRDLSPNVVTDSILSMEDRVMSSLSRPRAYAVVIGALAGLSLTIAGVGLFGVLSYTVSQRTKEIGVRRAIGAGQSHIAGLVVREVVLMIGLGIASGMAITFLTVETLSSLLFGIGAYDGRSFLAAVVAIGLVAALACIVPIKRALSIEPIQAMRGR